MVMLVLAIPALDWLAGSQVDRVEVLIPSLRLAADFPLGMRQQMTLPALALLAGLPRISLPLFAMFLQRLKLLGRAILRESRFRLRLILHV